MKEIQLTQDQVSLVDDEDYEYLNQWKWSAHYSPSVSSYYAVRNSSRTTGKALIYMHRVITKAIKGLQCDHINHNTLDNRKENLRVCSVSQNHQNKDKYKNNKSGYKGVSRHGLKWRAQLVVNGVFYLQESFENKEDAARAYDKAAKQYHGEFAYLNFPENQ